VRFEFTPGQVAALLVPSWQSFRNRRRSTGKGDVLRGLLFAFVGLVFSLFIFGGFYRMLLYIGQFAEFTAPLTHQVLATTSAFILTVLFASTVVTALSTQYLSDDLSLLVSSPISLPALYGSRLILTALQSSWMVVLFSIPIYAAFALTSPAPWQFLGAAALALAPLVVIATTVGSMVTSVLMAVFPARRVREMLVLLTALFVVLLVFLIRVQQPEKLLNPRSIYDISEFFAAFQTPSSSLLPSSWATSLLIAGRRAEPLPAMPLALLWSTIWRVAMMLPTTLPLTTTVFERIFASMLPVSPTMRVFSLVISPLKVPSIRTVSLKVSFPSNSEPWSMKAVRFALEALDGAAAIMSSPPLPRPKLLIAMPSPFEPS